MNFVVELTETEKREGYDSIIKLDSLETPVYINKGGHKFYIWNNDERIDIPIRFLKPFLKILEEKKIEYEND